jgi:GT2 family glycosyltransferase
MTILSTRSEPTDWPTRQHGFQNRPVDPSELDTPPPRVDVTGKFLQVAEERFWVKGVTYGTFAPDAAGQQFPPPSRIAEDFALMRRVGVNTVRTYTVPDRRFLDLAQQHGLRVMAGLAWAHHVAFLDDRRMSAGIRREVMAQLRTIASHPAVLLVALGNEIPAAVVRWLGPERVERFLFELYSEAKAIAPESLFTYVNYPPTEYLNLAYVDVFAVNLYLHREADLRAYLARLQNIAGHKPLLVAEAGADSTREGVTGQAALTAMQLRAAFAEGSCGAIAFAWTDEWWRGGHSITDWAFGLVDAERCPKPALQAVAEVFSSVPFHAAARSSSPKVSVVVCAYNAADTIDECLTSLEHLTYPQFEVIVVNDGSRDDTGDIARRHPSCRVIDVIHGGLSVARNVGLAAATGEIVAYTDADVRVDRDWLTYLIQPFLNSEVAGAGGLSLAPPDSPWMAQCVARAPGGPTHVLIDDRTAEHVPGCNMAFRRDALLAIGGFNPIYLRAGDDVDVCWQFQARGWKIGFIAAAVVWHHHRASVGAFWRQQVGYGEGQSWLIPHHLDKFRGSKIAWRGHIYSPLPFVRSLSRPRVNTGVWGTAAFPSIYHTQAFSFALLPHRVRWQIASAILILASLLTGMKSGPAVALAAIGLTGLGITVVQCVRYARASDVESLPNIGRYSQYASRAIYRVVIAWLHLIQPFARATGQLRGVLSPPKVVMKRTIRSPFPSPGDVLRTLYLMGHGTIESKFWAERWVSTEVLLTKMTCRLRDSPLTRTLKIEDGWPTARDIRVAVKAFAWLDLLVLVEDHGAGRSMVRVGHKLRPAALSVIAALAIIAWTIVEVRGETVIPWWAASTAGIIGLLLIGTAVWRSARTLAAASYVIRELALEVNMWPISTRSARWRFRNRRSAAPMTPAQPQS